MIQLKYMIKQKKKILPITSNISYKTTTLNDYKSASVKCIVVLYNNTTRVKHPVYI